MRVHLIKRRTIEEFCLRNPQSRRSFRHWLSKVRYADWVVPADILRTFAGADLLGSGSNRVVFDVAGNRYRLIAKYVFGSRQVHLFVCWIGTHAEYDRLCRDEKQYEVSDY